MTRQSPVRRWLTWLLGTAAVLVALVMAYLAVQYRQESVALKAARDHLKQVQDVSRPEPKVADVPPAVVAAGLPPGPQVPQWLAEFGRSADAAGLVWTELRQNEQATTASGAQAKPNVTSPRKVTFEATLGGDFTQISRFIADLRHWERLVHAQKWQIEPAAAAGTSLSADANLSTGALTLKVTLTAYVAPEQAGTAAATTPGH